jgi:hypothetical protein
MLGQFIKYYLERKWKKAVVTYFKTLHQHFSGKTEENHGNFSQDS